MASGVNLVILVGNLGRDPEMRTTQSGAAVVNFSLATAESVKKNGEWKEETTWHNIVVFGKTAENAAKYLAKGSRVYLEGRINHRKWSDKEGRERVTDEILTRELRFLDTAKRERQPDQGGGFPDGDEYDPDAPF